MSQEHDVEGCTRQAVIIDGERYYLVVGDSFVSCTVPRENNPVMSRPRKIVETICEAITRVMEKRRTREDENDVVEK